MLQRLALHLSLSMALCGVTLAAEQPSELLDLHYGESLYQFYQNNHFDAMVHLLSARQQGYMQAYGNEPELLLGGVSLAYGMTDEAEALFQRVLDREPAPEIHDRAWLLVAKSRHRRDQTRTATAALGQVGNALMGENRSEHHALAGLLALQGDDNGTALNLLQHPPADGIWSRYVLFNRAIALLRNGQGLEAQKVLWELDDLDAEDEESKSLRDRANLLLGFLLLEAKQPKEARKALERVRLDGLAATQALLGLGWTALQEGNPTAALAPWQQLSQHNPEDPPVLEAMLAIPYVLSQLGAEQQSLERYQQVISLLGREHEKLEKTVEEIRQGQLLTLLQDDKETPEQPPGSAPELLSLLLTENRFQESLQDYRDLRFLHRNLQQWSEKIGTYRTMLAVREDAYRTALPKVGKKLSGDELQALEKRRELLAERATRTESAQEPPYSLATEEELQLLARFDRLDELLQRLDSTLELTALQQRAKLLRGTLIWRTITEHPARRWEMTKQLRDLDRSLEQARQQQASLQRAHQETRGRFNDFAGRIEHLERQIPALVTQLTEASRALRQLMSTQAVEVLERRKQLLHDYLIQARFGLASLLDRNSGSGAQ